MFLFRDEANSGNCIHRETFRLSSVTCKSKGKGKVKVVPVLNRVPRHEDVSIA
jgi:hypothetical protein